MQRPPSLPPSGLPTTARQGKGGRGGVAEQKLSKDFLLLLPGPLPPHLSACGPLTHPKGRY